MFPKAVLTHYLQTLHALASCFSFGSFGFLSLHSRFVPFEKELNFALKIFWVCLWLRNTSNTSLTTWFISVFTIYRVLLLSTLWCRLIFELLFVSACRIRDRSQIKNFFHSSLAIFVPSNSYFGTMRGLRRLLALLAKGLDFFFMICTESFWLHFVSGSNNYRFWKIMWLKL